MSTEIEKITLVKKLFDTVSCQNNKIKDGQIVLFGAVYIYVNVIY
jgi:hypothetical protein